MKRFILDPIVLLGGILVLGSLGGALHKSSRVYLFQQAQCFNYYQIHDPTKIDVNYQIEEALCKLPFVQSRLSMVDGADSFLQYLPRKPCLHFPRTLMRARNLHAYIPMLTGDSFLDDSSAGARSIQNAFRKICFASSCNLELVLLRVRGSVLHNSV